MPRGAITCRPATSDPNATGTQVRRRSSHSDTVANSGDLPTPAELQKAALTLLAAKQHGLYDEVFHPEDVADINQRLDRLSSERDLHQALQESVSENNYGTRFEGSGRSMRSVNSSIPEAHSSTDDLDGFPSPKHGILNRGGSYPLTPSATGSNRHLHNQFVSGSSRTLSSMSSLEDDFNSAQVIAGSFRGLTVPAVHEETDDCGLVYAVVASVYCEVNKTTASLRLRETAA